MVDAPEPQQDEAASGPPSERTRVRRGAPRAVYDRDVILSIIDAAPICHVGVLTDDGPLVVPMAHGRDDEDLFLHGATANGALRAAVGNEVCVTFTLLDGFVFARSPFHNSMNHRSVVLRGVARRLEGDAELAALRAITDHVAPNWDAGRPPNEAELRRTMAVAIPLAEASAKVRQGDPVDEPEDLDGPWWAGTVPVEVRYGEPVAATDLRVAASPPPGVAGLA